MHIVYSCLYSIYINFCYKNNSLYFSYETAYTFFQESLKRIQTSDQTVLPVKWEGLLNNLGHACRKLKLVIIYLFGLYFLNIYIL